MKLQDAIRFARFYLYNETCYKDGSECRSDHGGIHLDGKPITDYKLHRHLQFYLCSAFERLSKTFGEDEIVSKDIALIVEAWILSTQNNWERDGVNSDWRRVSSNPIVLQNSVMQIEHHLGEFPPKQ